MKNLILVIVVLFCVNHCNAGKLRIKKKSGMILAKQGKEKPGDKTNDSCLGIIQSLKNKLECYKEAPTAKFSRDCRDTFPRRKLACKNGIIKIYPLGYNCEKNMTSGFEVFCDQETNKGGWTVIQRRKVRNIPPPNPRKQQVEDWENFVKGFGNLENDFWLGLDQIYQLTRFGEHMLRVDIQFSGKFTKLSSLYTNFKISGPEYGYRITASGFSGNAGDFLTQLNGVKFSRYVGPKASSFACSALNWGGWWFKPGYPGCIEKATQDLRWLGNVKIRNIEMKVKRKTKTTSL